MGPNRASQAVRWVLGGLATVLVMYLVVLPAAWMAWDLFWPAETAGIRRVDVDMDWSERLRVQTMEWVVTLVVFFLGASIGSFLNVVAYRLPNRVPLFLRRSRCPNCNEGIRAKDNLPLVGWLRLGGRCRNCQNPISIRYPLVELIMGSIFVALFFSEWLSGGGNLPNRVPNVYTGVVWTVLYFKADLASFFFFHQLLFALLLILVLVDFDRLRLDVWAFGLCSLWLVAPLMFEPGLHLWPLPPPISAWFGQIPRVSTCVLMTLGGGLGWIIGWLLASRSHLSYALAWTGIALGWQAVLGATFFLLAVRILGCLASRCLSSKTGFLVQYLCGDAGWTLWALCAIFLHHLAWRGLAEIGRPWWPSDGPGLTVLGVWFLVGGVGWAVNRGIRPQNGWTGPIPTHTDVPQVFAGPGESP